LVVDFTSTPVLLAFSPCLPHAHFPPSAILQAFLPLPRTCTFAFSDSPIASVIALIYNPEAWGGIALYKRIQIIGEGVKVVFRVRLCVIRE
jgi:hypothetical protein